MLILVLVHERCRCSIRTAATRIQPSSTYGWPVDRAMCSSTEQERKIPPGQAISPREIPGYGRHVSVDPVTAWILRVPCALPVFEA